MTFVRSGLRWHKLDLHVHSPASKDYRGPPITPGEFVTQALAKGLHGIAITDHNSGEWIDKLIAAAKGTDLAIFPGVEISVTGGKNGIHIIALFERDATTKTIENLLAKLHFDAQKYGQLEAISNLGPEAVVEEIDAVGGVAILAHADSSKGVLADMSGQQRNNVMNSPHLSAVEIINVAKTAPFCSGTDPNYKRKLAYYRASDNRTPVTDDGHSLDGVGSRFSWFKTDGLSLDALRQAFTDPDLRIKCDTDSPDIPGRMYPRILSATVSQGFLKGMTFSFHEGLNSIIGGKGVGKSVLIELLRFALNQPSMIADVQLDMAGKLAEQLGVGGEVQVKVQLEADQVIEVTRTYNGTDNPTKAIYSESGKAVVANIGLLFPVLAYSQTETLEIAKDNHAQLELIDTLLDLASIEGRIATLETALAQSDLEIAGGEAAQEQLAAAEKDLATHDEKIAALDRALKSKELDAVTNLKPKSDCLAKVADFADAVEEVVDGLASDIKAITPPRLPPGLASDTELEKLLALLTADGQAILDLARNLEHAVEVAAKRARAGVTAWDNVVQSKKKEYKAFILKQGGDRPALLARKSALEGQRPAVAKAVAALEQRIAALPKLRATRTSSLAKVDAEVAERHSLRKAKFRELTAASNGRLELVVHQDADRSGYIEALSLLKTGSRVQDSSIVQVCNRVPPRQLVAYVRANDAVGLTNMAGIQITTAKNLVGHLASTADTKGLLALEHGNLLRDSPTIRFRKDDGKYYELSQLSVGQKCTALLIIALADGSRPIIIDQPEDALDITSVYEDVTLQIRGRKDARQFILTTHNPTVAVASDSDQFHVLRASATQASLATDGAIDRPLVRAAVIQHLEGGAEPFRLKARKYGLPAL